jgi:hypothetical protein
VRTATTLKGSVFGGAFDFFLSGGERFIINAGTEQHIHIQGDTFFAKAILIFLIQYIAA